MTALRQRMLEDMQLRRFSPHTVEAYLRAVTKLAQFYKRSPDRISKEEVRTFLVDVVKRKKAAPSTYNQVRCALVFFYRVTLGREFALERIVCQRNGKKLPTVLSLAEMVQFFQAARSLKYRALFMTTYAAGLACVGSHQPGSEGHRQQAHGAARSCGEGPEGSVGDAVGEVAAGAAVSTGRPIARRGSCFFQATIGVTRVRWRRTILIAVSEGWRSGPASRRT